VKAELLSGSRGEADEGAVSGQDSWTLLGLDFVPEVGGRVWLVDVEATPQVRRVGPHGGPPDESDSRSCVTEQDSFARTLLVDMIDIVIGQRRNEAPHGDNQWLPIGNQAENGAGFTPAVVVAAQAAERAPEEEAQAPGPGLQEVGASSAEASVSASGDASENKAAAEVEVEDNPSVSVDASGAKASAEVEDEDETTREDLLEALKLAEENLLKAREAGDKEEQANMWLCIAELHIDLADFKAALKAAKSARAFARELESEAILERASTIIEGLSH